MSKANFRMSALAGTTLLGAFVYYNTSSRDKHTTPAHVPPHAKKESNQTGASAGSNTRTENSSQVEDADRKAGSTAPKEKLPQGGVGGGVGAGGANSRSIELSASKPGGATAGPGGDSGLSEAVHKLAGAGGQNTLEPGSSGDKMYDSRVASHQTNTPTKRV